MIDAVPRAVPTSALAATTAQAVTGRMPVETRRFNTGSAHYVFEVALAGGGSVVVRMGMPAQRASMAGGLRLSHLLRPLGVPLPKVVAEGLDGGFPWLMLERLPGTDLGHVINNLSSIQLQAIAEGVSRAQTAAARIGSAARCGYAVTPGAAPHARWSDVLRANLARSHARLSAAGLFEPGPVDAVAALITARQAELDAMPATAFLHDTTTKNVIVAQDGTLSGIVDVDDLCFGDPRYPVALTLVALKVADGPVSYVEAWMHAAGYSVDALFQLYVALFLVDFMSEHGQRFNGNERPSRREARDMLLQTFAKTLHRAQCAVRSATPLAL